MRKRIFLMFLGLISCFQVFADAKKDAILIEAEDMAHPGNRWYVRKHFGGWYTGVPSGVKMLAGCRSGDETATKRIVVDKAGEYKIWVRYLDLKQHRKNIAFKMTVTQNGKSVSKVFDDSPESVRATSEGAKRWGGGWARFVWDSMTAELAPGEVVVELSKCHPKTTTTACARMIDCIVLSKDLKYQPKTSDFFKPLYLKVKMGANQKVPAVIHIFGRRPRSPWYTGHYNVNKIGMFKGSNRGTGAKVAIPAGGESPWVDIAPMLSLTGLNKVGFYACLSYFKRLDEADFTLCFSKTKSMDGLIKAFSREGRGCGMVVSIDLCDLEGIASGLEGSARNLEMALAVPEVPGRRPALFPIGTGLALSLGYNQRKVWLNEFKALSAIGLSYLETDPALAATPEFSEMGFKKISAGSFYYHKVKSRGCLNSPKTDAIRGRIAKIAENMKKLGVQDKVLFMNLMDEPSVSLKHILKCDVCWAGFVEYLKSEKVSPEILGVSKLDDAVPTDDSEKHPALYYYTMRFRARTMADFFKIGTDAVGKCLPKVPTLANFSTEMLYNMLARGADWFENLNSGALTMGWTEDWLNLSMSYQLAGYQCDLMRSACERNDYPFGMYNILSGRSPWEIVAKGVTEAGHGARAIHFFNYGPSYAISSDTNSHDPKIYAPIKKLSHLIGGVEKTLMDGKVAAGDVAMLYSNTSDIWGLRNKGFANTNGLERSYLHLLLTHSGYRVDILSEESLPRLGGSYKTLFLTGTHLRKSIVPVLERWVANGGTLCLSPGAVRFDEFNRPLGLLEKLGCVPGEIEKIQTPGRPPYEIPKRKVIGEVVVDDDVIPAICVRAKFADGTPTAKFKDGQSAVVETIFKKGRIVRFGFLPALSYLREAVLKNKALKKGKKYRRFYSCRWYPEAPRSLMRRIISSSGIKPKVAVSNYLVDASVIESPDSVVISLANWTGEPLKELAVTLRGFKPFKKITNANGDELKAVYENDSVRITTDLSEGDFVLCEK